jgi:hypothetical protein
LHIAFELFIFHYVYLFSINNCVNVIDIKTSYTDIKRWKKEESERGKKERRKISMQRKLVYA